MTPIKVIQETNEKMEVSDSESDAPPFNSDMREIADALSDSGNFIPTN